MIAHVSHFSGQTLSRETLIYGAVVVGSYDELVAGLI